MRKFLLAMLAPEREAFYALQWNVPRSELSKAGQLEYDRLRPAWERGPARLTWELKHPPATEELELRSVAGPQRRSPVQPEWDL
jgi:hypothetical protein